MKRIEFISIPFIWLFLSGTLFAQDDRIADLKAEIQQLRNDYEQRIKNLESQIEQLQAEMLQIPTELPPAPQPVAPTTAGALNPAISVIGNFLGRADSDDVFTEEGDLVSNKMNLRETELDMRVAVDPYADGVLIAAFESEAPGEFEVGVEEGYVNVKALPFWERTPLGLRLKVGRFRTLFGKMNILHTHDLPTSLRPLPVEEFLGEEGFVQAGVSGNFFIPTPWDENSSLDATVEIIDGGGIAISPQSEARLSYNAHLRWFKTIADANDLELGWSTYFHPSGNGIDSATMHGFDFFYRWRPLRQGQWKSFLLGAELMFAPDVTAEEEEEEIASLEENKNGETPFGFTAFTQWQFNRRFYAGVRFDHTDVVLNPALQRQSITPYISYYFSEFLRFRLNYERRWSDLFEEDGRNSLFLEMNWIFGAHPPEPFWVNK